MDRQAPVSAAHHRVRYSQLMPCSNDPCVLLRFCRCHTPGPPPPKLHIPSLRQQPGSALPSGSLSPAEPLRLKAASLCPGPRCQLSERPLLCASVHWGLGEAAVGGSDHAVYILDAASCRLKRTLFKAGGHFEWVSCLTHTPEGHVVSGAMPQSVLSACWACAESARLHSRA